MIEHEPELNIEISAPDLGPVEVDLDATAETVVPDIAPPKMAAPKTQDSKILDRIIIGTCLFIFATSSYLIVDERFLFSMSGDQKNLEVIAQMTRGGKDIRRRFEQDAVWYGAAAPDKIYQADSIFNGEKTDLEITFKDNTKISVNPGSLVVVRKSMDGQNKLKVETGTVTASMGSDKTLVLESQGKEVKLSGGDAKATLSVNRGEGSSISVLSGNAVLKSGGQVQKLEKNQIATTDASGKIEEIKTVPIELTEPQSGALIWYTLNKNINFKWTPQKDAQNYTIQFANDFGFKNVVSESKVFSNNFRTQSIAGNRTYYWRVVAKTKKGNVESMVSQFNVKTDFGPRLILPGFDRILKIPQKIERDPAAVNPNKPIVSVLLQWQDETGGKVFKVQVSKSEKFENLVYENTVPSTTVETPKLPTGKYFWRVKVEDNTRPEASWSRLSQFTVGEAALDGAPLWIFPRNLQQIVMPKSKTKLRLQWEKREGATNYDIQISKTPDFSSVIYSQNVKSILQDWDADQTGTYYSRVRGITSTGEVTEFSTPVRFDIVKKKTLPAPMIIKPKQKYETSLLEMFYHFFVSTAQGAQGPMLEWQAVEGAAKYKIEISKTKGFESIISTFEITSTSTSLTNPQPGNYFWRVTAISADGEMGQASEPGEVVVSAGPPTPYTSGPLEGKASPEDIQKGKVNVDLKWSASTFAKSYEVQISEEPSFDGALSKTVNSSNEKISLPKTGNYFWRVRSLGPDGTPVGRFSDMKEIEIKKVVSDTATATTTAASPPPHVRVPAPSTPGGFAASSNYTDKGVRVDWNMPKDKVWTHNEQVIFTWTKAQTVKLYHLRVYKHDNNPKLPAKLLTDINTKSSTYFVDHLDPGNYYAVIDSVKYDNGRGPSPNPFTFKVRRAKPIEFGHVDLKLSYSARLYTALSSIRETNTEIMGSALGGTTQMEADSTFNHSNFGIKTSAFFNSMKFAGSNLVLGDITLAGTYRFDDLLEKGSLKSYFGVRARQMPFIIPDHRMPTTSGYYEFFLPTTVGPVVGMEYEQKFNNSFGAYGIAQLSAALTNSVIGTFDPNIFTKPTINTRLEGGLVFIPSLFNNLNIFVGAGIETDEMKWDAITSSGGGESHIRLSSTYAKAGIEILTDSKSYYAPKEKYKAPLFGDVDFRTSFSLLSFDYDSHTNRSIAPPLPVYFTNLYGTQTFISGEGWFDNTDFGIRLAGSWTQFPLQNQSVGFGETSVELGYKPWTIFNSGIEISNFVGIRLWDMPGLEHDGSGSNYFAYTNSLAGVQNTLKLTFKFSKSFSLEMMGQGSLPLLTTSARTYMGALNTMFGSYRYEGGLRVAITEDFSLGATYGKRFDQYRYISLDQTAPSDSYITIQSPITSIYLNYSL